MEKQTNKQANQKIGDNRKSMGSPRKVAWKQLRDLGEMEALSVKLWGFLYLQTPFP
jgi:hypothetical protein